MFTEWPDGLNLMLAVDAACDGQGLPLQLLELVRLWCSILNGCRFCIAMHRRKVVALGVSDALVVALIERRDLSGLDEDERAAICYAAVLTAANDVSAITGAKVALAAHFDARQLVALTYAIAQTNAWNRLVLADHATGPSSTTGL